MYEPTLLWAAFAVLVLLVLPFSGPRKLVLELCSWSLRLALLAVLAGGAFLWFRPDLLPAEVVTALNHVPAVWDILPAPGSQPFGLAVACLVTAVCVPALAVLDVTRKLAGDRLRRLRQLTDAPRVEPAPAVVEAPAVSTPAAEPGAAPVRSRTPPVQRRPDRRAAADTLAEIGSRKPFRVADHLS